MQTKAQCPTGGVNPGIPWSIGGVVIAGLISRSDENMRGERVWSGSVYAEQVDRKLDGRAKLGEVRSEGDQVISIGGPRVSRVGES